MQDNNYINTICVIDEKNNKTIAKLNNDNVKITFNPYKKGDICYFGIIKESENIWDNSDDMKMCKYIILEVSPITQTILKKNGMMEVIIDIIIKVEKYE